MGRTNGCFIESIERQGLVSVEGEKYLIGLGYGGKLESMARFEWDFRCMLGLRDPQDEQKRNHFIREFAAATSPDQPVVLVLDDYNNLLFRTFAELGKRSINKYPDLFVFMVVEDQSRNPSVQYFLNLETDPIDEPLQPHQLMIDAEEVPDEVFVFLQSRLDIQFYRRDDEVMMEFRIEELPV